MEILKSKGLISTEKVQGVYHTLICHTRELPQILATGTIEGIDSLFSYLHASSHQVNTLSTQQKLSNMLQEEKESHDLKVQKQQAEYEKEIKKLNRDIERLKSESESSNKATEILQTQLRNSQELILNRLRDEKRELEQKHQEELSRWTEKLQKDLDHERSQNTESRKKISELEDKIATKRLQLANSSYRGATGEEDFKDLVKDLKGWSLNSTSKEKDSMDFSMEYKGIQIRFDTKNHESSVIPESDVVKVRKDLRHHPETDCGILVALHREVMYNKRKIEEIVIEWTPTQQLIIIIPKFLSLDLPLTLSWLETLFGCIKPYRKILKENDLNYEVALAKEREKNVSIASILEVSINELTESIKNLNRDKRTALAHINTMASTAESAFQSSMSRMKNIVDLIKEEAVPEQSEEQTKKKRGGKKKEVVTTIEIKTD